MTPELLGTNHQTEKAAEAAAQTEQVEAVVGDKSTNCDGSGRKGGVIVADDESPGSADSGGWTHEDEGPGSPNVDGRVVEVCAGDPDSADGGGACAHEICATGDEDSTTTPSSSMSVTELASKSQSLNTCRSVG